MNRRGFLGAILAAGVAPAVVRAESLMKWTRAPSGLFLSGTEIEFIDWNIELHTETISFIGMELLEVTLRSFTPRLVASLYKQAPILQTIYAACE